MTRVGAIAIKEFRHITRDWQTLMIILLLPVIMMFMFGYALKAEAVHAELYKRALEAVEQGKDLAEAGFYLCPVCGNIEFGAPPDNCPICGTRKERFATVA